MENNNVSTEVEQQPKKKLTPTERTRLWKAQNKQKCNEQQKRHRQKNLDKVRAYHREYQNNRNARIRAELAELDQCRQLLSMVSLCETTHEE